MTRNFHLWLIQPEDYLTKDEAMNLIWEELVSTITKATYKSLNEVKARLGMISLEEETVPLRRKLMRVAAVLLPVVFVVGGYFVSRQMAADRELVRMETPYGKTEQCTLADGTVVHLNAGSLLEYPVRFRGKERQVRLRGEGFFKVTPDKRKPFTVISRNLQTTVLGTEFNIKAYDNQKNESVTVLSGEVNVATPDGTTHDLTPNRHLTHWDDTGATDVEYVDAASMVSWINDGLVFENSTLEDILVGLQRKYSDLRVVVADSTQLTNTLYRMKFDNNESLDYILDVIYKVSGVPYTLDGDTLTIGGE
jgi:ferric-dicitrate binding protein FerR (iron transport regulator)